MMNKYIGTAAFDPGNVRGFHLLTNIIIQLDGDRATAWSRIVYMTRNKDDKPVPAMGGHYDDTLIREDGHWKFLRRVVMMEIPFQDPREIKGEPPPPPVSRDSNGERIQRAEDRQEIEELLTAYGSTLDRRDFAAFGQLFTEDAVYSGGPGEPVRGRAAIQASLEKTLAANPAHLPGPDFHLFFDPSIHVEGDRATVRSKGAYAIPDTGGTNGVPGVRMVFFTQYDDVLVRKGGHWLFQQRSLGRPQAGP